MTCTYTGGEKLFKNYFYYLVCDFAACIYASCVCSNPGEDIGSHRTAVIYGCTVDAGN